MGVHVSPILNPHSHLPPHPIPQGHPSASALSTLSHSSNLDWWSISHMIIYISQWYSLKSSHPHLLPQNPKDCPLHLCLFCCIAYISHIYLLFNMLSRFVIALLPRRMHLLISWLQSPSAVTLKTKKIKSVAISTFSPFFLPWSDGARCHGLNFLTV